MYILSGLYAYHYFAHRISVFGMVVSFLEKLKTFPSKISNLLAASGTVVADALLCVCVCIVRLPLLLSRNSSNEVAKSRTSLILLKIYRGV